MALPWIVLKYGGTSVASAARWERIADRVRELAADRRVLVVVSAQAGVTNLLERAVDAAVRNEAGPVLEEITGITRALAMETGVAWDAAASRFEDASRCLQGIALTRDAPPKLRARVLASGERVMSALGREILGRRGIEARLLDAGEVLVSEAGPREGDALRFLEARVNVARDPERITSRVGDARVVVTQGFLGSTPDGDTCLLGRGGSDTSAALFAALLGAGGLEIWTDVHGLFTADPAQVPGARLIRRIGYREAQELAAMGGKVLHPRCLGPVAAAGIPVRVKCIDAPSDAGTLIEASAESHPAVTAVSARRGVVLITVTTSAMYETPGYLARVFASFEEHGFSVDLVATSQTAVTVTLDRVPGGVDGRAFERLLRRLEELGRVSVVHPCAVVSIVGRRIRAVLHEIGPALEVFQERPVHLVSDSSEDLNLSFVVDDADGPTLVARLHRRFFSMAEDGELGPTWEALRGAASPQTVPWWRERAPELCALVADGRARYVYHPATVAARAHRLRDTLPAVGDFYFAMKANAHPVVLETLAESGFGFECVSAAEVRRVREVVGPNAAILFTPNFCPVSEYAEARDQGAELVLDGPQVFALAPELFRGMDVGVRVDPGQGFGHHRLVVTAGAAAKFGLALNEVAAFAEAARQAGARVVGLHAHVGSGIHDPEAWGRTGAALAGLLAMFPEARWLDVGGGLGVPEQPGQPELNLAALGATLAGLRDDVNPVTLRLEPGRYLVSEAGVLVAPVTQVRRKGSVHFAGVATGMNSLLRPALYGAWHRIHNLSRLDETAERAWQVVGPVCESADVLGRDRRIPDPRPGDVLLIENAGAYGAVMASRYNLREPAEEVILS